MRYVLCSLALLFSLLVVHALYLHHEAMMDEAYAEGYKDGFYDRHPHE